MSLSKIMEYRKMSVEELDKYVTDMETDLKDMKNILSSKKLEKENIIKKIKDMLEDVYEIRSVEYNIERDIKQRMLVSPYTGYFTIKITMNCYCDTDLLEGK